MENRTDHELVQLILSSGDKERELYIIHLIQIRYAESLITKGSAFCKDKKEVKEKLSNFVEHMKNKSKKEQKDKFQEVAKNDNIERWLRQCFHNYLVDEVQRSNKHDIYDENLVNNTIVIDKEESSPSIVEYLPTDIPDNNPDGIEELQKCQDRKDLLYIQILESFNRLSARERYIVFTYFYCERMRQDSTPLHLDEILSKILGVSKDNVRKIKSEAYKKIKNMFKGVV